MKNTCKLLLLILAFGLGLQSNLQAQTQVPAGVVPGDSLALIALYQKAGGPDWRRPWDLSQPIATWQGVTLSQNGNRVVALDMAEKGLRDSIPQAFNALSALERARFSANKLENIAPLTGLTALKEIELSGNSLTFDDIIIPLDDLFRRQVVISYNNQDSIGNRKIVPAYQGGELVLTGRFDPQTRNGNNYNWYKGQVANNRPFSQSRILRQKVDTSAIGGSYYYTITNPDYPDLTLVSKEIVVKYRVGKNPFPNGPLSFVLTLNDAQLQDSVYLDTIQAKLKKAGGTKVDSCLCGTFEVWDFDSILTANGVSIDPKSHGAGLGVIPPREDSAGNKTRPGFDINYRMKFGDESVAGGKWVFDASAIKNLPNINNPQKEVVVAVIDMGIEAKHPAFGGRSAFYVDPSSESLGMDDCYPNDPSGINLMNPGQNPFNDVSGHGTHVAGIVKSVLPWVPIKLMSIQVGDQPNTATVFKVACGIEYALRHQVDVINISMGYQGERVALLDSIMTTPRAKKAFFVTAAGNDGDSNDLFPHWPSNLAGELDNNHIMAVASFGKDPNTGQFGISPNSNFSPSKVTLAAPGENIFSAVNKGKYDFKSGTSMSVGFVSAFAAALKASNPNLKPFEMAEIMLTSNMTVFENGFETSVVGGRRLNVDMIDCFSRPQAMADTANLSWFELAKEISVYTNDCIGNTNISPRLIVLPSSGTVKWDSDSLTYRYSANFLSWIMGANDSFTYQICPSTDNQNNCSEAIVTVNKQGVGIWGVIILILLLIILVVRRIRNNPTP